MANRPSPHWHICGFVDVIEDSFARLESAHLRNLRAICDVTRDFVEAHAGVDQVGQSFVAALFDLLFVGCEVRMGQHHARSAVLPGDVQVGADGAMWLWAEVTYTQVVTSEIQDFVNQVSGVGGDRAFYFALRNHLYPQSIDHFHLKEHAAKDGISLMVYSSAEQALEDILPVAAGSAGTLAVGLANRMLHRLHEAQVTGALEEAWVRSIEDAAG
jgi:hypothetical protein